MPSRYDACWEGMNLNTELFVDLLFTSKKILDLTTSTDILILIGESPAYLGPILKHHRKIIYLPMTDKPFSCYSNLEYDKNVLTTTHIPTQKGLDNYFNYLNTQTILTKKFAKNNWNNLVGIDTSSGASANGTSIFLNKYAKNIKSDTNCENIINAKQLRFINFIRGDGISSFNKNLVNPTHIIFYHTGEFIDSIYKRFVPSYRPDEWENETINDRINENWKKNQYIKKQIYDLYNDFKNDKKKLLIWLKKNCALKKLKMMLKNETKLDNAIIIIYDYVIKTTKDF